MAATERPSTVVCSRSCSRVRAFIDFKSSLFCQFDVDASAQQIGGARQLQRKTRLPVLDGDAGAQRRFHSPRQERGPGWQPTNLALADGLQSLLDDLLI